MRRRTRYGNILTKSLRTMVIHNKSVVVYDIEIFPNVFHCACKDTELGVYHKFEISERKNDLKELVDYFYYEGENKLFCGYNNKHYDDVVINYLIDYSNTMLSLPASRITTSLFNLSGTIVNSQEGNIDAFKKWKYANFFESMDLLTMQFSSKLRVGLKEMQVTMFYDNVQEYEGDFNNVLMPSDIDKMIEYNINDVNSTEELLNRLNKHGDIDVRLFVEKEYGFNALSMDSVKFGETILAGEYCKAKHISKKYLETLRSPMDYVPLKDVILPVIKYKNPILNSVLEEMRQQVVPTRKELIPKGKKAYEKSFVISNTCYSVGVGGIHSLNKPEIYIPDENEYIGHADVTSMYPSFIVQYGWVPRHLGKEFWQIYCKIYYSRIEAKHSGQDVKSTALKLVLNSVTGKMQQETSWLYDPFSVFKIRINGQLVLLMLVDRLLELGCKIVQVNTDGVMYVARKDRKDRVQEAIHEVEGLTKLGFETDSYEAFYQYAVNDYFGVVEGYSQSRNPKLIEKKGMFITDAKLGKGLAPLIIPKAVINYFVNKQPVSEFIRNHDDIKDFLMTQRVDKKFKVEWANKPTQRINRYYASTNGYYLFKVKDENGHKEYSNMLTKSGVTLLNKLDSLPIKDRKINYQYYIAEANKIIENLVCRQLELF